MAKAFISIKMLVFLFIAAGLSLWAMTSGENPDVRTVMWYLAFGYYCLFWHSLLELQRQD